VIVTARVPARCRRSTDDTTGLQSPVERAIVRSPSRAPRSDGTRYFSRGDRPIARFLRTRGVAQQREDASQSRRRRHRASRTVLAGVSTHLVGCSTKCAGRAGRPGEEEKLVSCGVSSISIPPLMNENSSPEPKLRSRVKNLNRRISDFPPPVPPRCTFLSIYGL